MLNTLESISVVQHVRNIHQEFHNILSVWLCAFSKFFDHSRKQLRTVANRLGHKRQVESLLELLTADNAIGLELYLSKKLEPLLHFLTGTWMKDNI
jgi:bacterioferritin (cytochrome b1)